MRKLKNWISMLLLAVAVTMVAGCSFNPLGMSDAEWESLTPTQQFEARKIQAERDEAARVRYAEQEAQEVAEQAQLDALRRNAPFGDVVQCTITDAKAYFYKDKWRPAQPVSIEMYRGESEHSLSLVRQDRTSRTTDVYMSFDGLSVKACRGNSSECDVLVGTEAQFRRGITKRINVHKTVVGTLFCSFPRRF